ncbi:M13 family metallopeptidase [Massilia sp. DD77]|uniref:M13 family metallopeptidase n=1 Tax=Massilia sp. DD77 TaxID=3109349 RepID=UPI002FFEF573
MTIRTASVLFALFVPFAALAAAPAATGPARAARQDLYLAANGAWLASARIPDNQSEVYGADLPASTAARVRGIVDGLRKEQQPAGSTGRKLVDYYDSQVDMAGIEKAGLAPLQPLLAALDAAGSPAELARWQGQVQGILKTPLWFWGGFADFKDPGLNRALLMQGGLGMPSRDDYLGEAGRAMQLRTAYLAYLTQLSRLGGVPEPAQAAQRVLALETRLATAQLPAAEAMNPAMVRTMDAPRLAQAAPGMDWASLLDGAGLRGGGVNVVQPAAARAIAGLMRDLPLADWKLYFRLRLLDASAPLLPAAFRGAHFDFHGKAVRGQAAPRDTHERALDYLTEALGDGLVQAYAARHFPPAQKARVAGMVEQIRLTAAEAVGALAWMEPATRIAARVKIERLKAKVGYPASWRDYRGLEVRPDEGLANRQRAQRHEWLRLAAQSGKPVQAGAWAMSPLEPNAFYDPVLNEINLPAAILQPPFFDPQADDAANYGGIGALIAHEISHAFDSTGSQFDSRGVQRDWWSKADHTAFDAFCARMVARFDAAEALPGARVNGKLTLPENIADLMGLQLAWRAYQATLGGRPAPRVGGRSGEQRFFLAYARQWAVKRRDERSLQLLATDPHAPAHLRANIPAMQLDGFHRAFATRPGDAMYLPAKDRLHAW